MLPLYRGQGDDGFFLGRDVKPFWLRLSALLRRLELQSLVLLLPGVRRHPDNVDSLLVDRSVARWQVSNVFHLFGYRRCRPESDYLVFSRRQE